METANAGSVTVPAKIENYWDLQAAGRGEITQDQVRRIEVSDARVDPGETYLCLPKRMIEPLGLKCSRTIKERTRAGIASVRIFDLVRLAIQGRDWDFEVKEVADEEPPIIGNVPLLALDWVVDHEQKKLIGNPDHGGEWMFDMFHQDLFV